MSQQSKSSNRKQVTLRLGRDPAAGMEQVVRHVMEAPGLTRAISEVLNVPPVRLPLPFGPNIGRDTLLKFIEDGDRTRRVVSELMKTSDLHREPFSLLEWRPSSLPHRETPIHAESVPDPGPVPPGPLDEPGSEILLNGLTLRQALERYVHNDPTVVGMVEQNSESPTVRIFLERRADLRSPWPSRHGYWPAHFERIDPVRGFRRENSPASPEAAFQARIAKLVLLRYAAIVRHLRSSGVTAHGAIDGVRRPIPAEEWGFKSRYIDFHDGRLLLMEQGIPCERWSGISLALSEKAKTCATRQLGRPSKYDWVRVTEIVTEHLRSNRFPRTQAALIRLIQELIPTDSHVVFSAVHLEEGGPDESSIRQYLKRNRPWFYLKLLGK